MARRQHGAVAHDQLIDLGYTRDSVRYRLKAGRLQSVHPGVYVFGAQPMSQRTRWFAALLATRPHPFLSHLSAAAICQIAREVGGVHLWTTNPSARNLRGVTVHRARRIDPADVTRVDGFPVTTVSRTLFDLAELLPFRRFEKAFEQADRMNLLDMTALGATAERNPGRGGLRAFHAICDSYLSTPDANEGIEREFQVLLREEGISPPLLNLLVLGQVVDCWWPKSRFVVELDSRGYHSDWAARERDMVRDAKLLRHGIPTLRVTSRRMREERPELVADLRVQTGRKPSLR
ncbi:MAG: hypothetical protein ABIZ50_05785 [Solirubrobacterales bacterium]